MAENKLYYDENLDVLSRYVKDESVDLVYWLLKRGTLTITRSSPGRHGIGFSTADADATQA